jgi:hypothetical protein
MKLNKFVAAGLLALASITGASAQTIHIVGSTAYRAAVNDAIRSILAPGYTFATTGTSVASTFYGMGGNSTCLWSGTIASGFTGAGSAIEIKTAFSGSIAGLADMCQGVKSSYVNDSASYSTSGTPSATAGDSEVADMAWTDTDAPTDELVVQHALSTTGTTAYRAISTNITNLTEAGTLASGEEGQGIVYFELVEEALTSGSTSPFTSLSTDNLESMIQNGYISLAQVNGSTSAAAQTTDIFLIGRSEDSGSRANVFACATQGATSLIGSVNTIQFLPTWSGAVQSYTDHGAATAGLASNSVEEGGTGSTLTTLQYWPAHWGLNSDPTIYWSQGGHSGYNAGSNVALALSGTDPITGVNVYLTSNRSGTSYTPTGSHSTPTGTYVVGYLAGSDAVTCTGGVVTSLNTTGAAATRIAYNGVQYSQAAVLNGSYNLWGYEHAYYLSTNANATATVQAEAIADIADEVYSVTAEDNANFTQNSSDDSAVGIFIPGNGNAAAEATELVTRAAPGAPTTEDYAP